jgi:hypothetical protein
MSKLFALIGWWIWMLMEQVKSIVANLSKEVVRHIDHYLLPLFSTPYIEQTIKPPTASIC